LIWRYHYHPSPPFSPIHTPPSYTVHRNEIIDPFNVFQNTPYYSLKALECSKPGDHVEFENVLGKEIMVGLSCCPYEEDGFNGGRVTEVAVVVEE
jgi:hypothetical protein